MDHNSFNALFVVLAVMSAVFVPILANRHIYRHDKSRKKVQKP
jgi:hypothetical protein